MMTIDKPLVCNLSLVQIVENGSANFLEATKTILGSRVGRNVWMRIHRPPRMTTRCREENRPRVELEHQGVGTGSSHTRAPRSI